MNFDHIRLEKEQKDAFTRIVETVKKIPRKERMKMVAIKFAFGPGKLIIPSSNSGFFELDDIVPGDLEELAGKGLLSISYRGKNENYLVSPEGFQYYEWLMKEMGKPVERIEKHTLNYFDSEDFRKKYKDAYEKLKQAEELLWASDSDANFSAIGHHCREAMQEFADCLYQDIFRKASEEPKSHDKNRVKAVIEKKKENIPSTVRPFLEALYSYWDVLSDLVQRQEHGAQKEGEPLNWEDARRVVFQTANVMFEFHRALMR